MAPGYSYAVYNNWAFLVPLIGSVFMFLLHISLPLIILDLEGPDAAFRSLVVYTRVVLRRALKIDNSNKITFHG